MCDGPIKFNGELEENLSIINISKHGRDFSVCRTLHIKLLMQELASMNVQMRIITDANVDQMTSMSYSNNINLLLHDPSITPKQINEKNEALRETRKNGEREQAQPRFGQDNRDYGAVPPPQMYGDNRPSSPAYDPVSPGYAPQSPGYAPQSPGCTTSPGYDPTMALFIIKRSNLSTKSPAYNPVSPGYAPQSPHIIQYRQGMPHSPQICHHK